MSENIYLHDDIKEFLIKHKSDLQRDDLDTIYADIATELAHQCVPVLTQFFISVGINPLNYFKKHVPSGCFYYISDLKGRQVIKPSVTDIGDFAFWGSNIEEIVLPRSLKNLGNDSLGYCTKLKKIYIRSSNFSLGSSGTQLFYDCENLTDIYVPWSEGSKMDKQFKDEYFWEGVEFHYNSKI